MRRLLSEPEVARRLGEQGRERVREQYLGLRHLIQYAELLTALDADRTARDERPLGAVAEHPRRMHHSEAEMASVTREDEPDNAHSTRSHARGPRDDLSR